MMVSSTIEACLEDKNQITISGQGLVTAISGGNCIQPLRSACSCQSLAVPNSAFPSTSPLKLFLPALTKLTNLDPLCISLASCSSPMYLQVQIIPCYINRCTAHLSAQLNKMCSKLAGLPTKLAIWVFWYSQGCQIGWSWQHVMYRLQLESQALISLCGLILYIV
jgi:hypothetical protein